MDVQMVVVVLVVGVAGFYVARTLWRTFTGRPTCGCGSNACSQSGSPKSGRNVELKVSRRNHAG